MQGRRYSEGGEVPVISFPPREDTVRKDLRTERRTTYIEPDKAETSGTSDPVDCFVFREFSERMQQFMLSYSYTLVTTKVLSGEV